MDRFARFVAILVIATLTIHLSDWPFVDELLEDARLQSAPRSQVAGPETGEHRDDMQTRVKLGMGVESLNAFSNLITPPSALPVYSPGALIDRFQPVEYIRAEFIVGAPFRPPAV